MKTKLALLILLTLIFAGCKCSEKQACPAETVNPNLIKVGVFNKNGDNPHCIIDAVESLRIDKDIDVRVISAAEIMSGAADDIDVYLFPGGSGRGETGNLGLLGQQKIIKKVKKEGKGIVGICAGAYILTNTPDYPSLALSGAKAIDIEHDHRGHGLAKFSLSEEGKKIFPELADKEINFCLYYEGPVMVPADNDELKYTELATMLSDVHTVEGTPANMTNNKPFITITKAGKGKAVSVVGHPECTQGMRWMIPRLVRLTLGKELISYDQNVVRPGIYKEEILFTKELLKKQKEARENLLGSKEEKLKAMKDIVNMRAWSAKKWIPQMVRDNDPEVRLLAAELTVELERTDALMDLKAAVKIEKDPELKKKLDKNYQLLKAMVKNK